jgi:hypothetical protein
MQLNKLARHLLLPLTFAGGIVGGCMLSDYIAITGFPHKKFNVELRQAGTGRDAFECQRMSNAFGPELSFFNDAKGVQDRCILEVAGELHVDGSMSWYPGNLTWYGRVIQNHPRVLIPAARILHVREVSR